MLVCTRLFNQPGLQSGQWTRAFSPWLIRLPLYCTRVSQRFYCPLLWSMTQLVEAALTGCSPSLPSSKAGAQSAAANVKADTERVFSVSPPLKIISFLFGEILDLSFRSASKSRIKHTSPPTGGVGWNKCKEGNVCSAAVGLHRIREIELAPKGMTFMFHTQRGETNLAALASLCNESKGQLSNTASNAHANQTSHMSALPTGGNKCLGHKYITTASWSYVCHAEGIRSEFHIGMLVEKSTFQQRWGGGGGGG